MSMKWVRSELTPKDIGLIVFIALALLIALVWGWFHVGPIILAVVLPLTVGGVVAIQLSAFRKIIDHQSRSAADAQNNYRQLESAVSLFSSLKISYPLPPLRGWAISPDFGVLLASVIFQSESHTILELGAGVSTLLLAYCIRRMGRGRIVSLEHDQDFADESRRYVAAHQLDDIVTIVHAPLRSHHIDGQHYAWYDVSKLPAVGPVDLLVIDGPPGPPGVLSRYPALPVFSSMLTDEAIIIVDDGERREEQETVRRWLTEFPRFKAKYVPLEKGALLLAKSWERLPASGQNFSAERDRPSPNNR